jgi:hypothetical protein
MGFKKWTELDEDIVQDQMETFVEIIVPQINVKNVFQLLTFCTQTRIYV